MSNDPLSKPPLALPAPEFSASSAETKPDDDAQKVLDAIARMERAVRGDTAAIGQVRSDLAEMAGALAQAKDTLKSGAIDPANEQDVNVSLLLRQLEGRLGALMDVVGAAKQGAAAPSPTDAAPANGSGAKAEAPAPAAMEQPEDRVPTVSNVVSRLGRSGPALPAAVDWTDERSARGSSDGPTVSMLEAMVQKLAAEVPATPPAAKPEPEPARPAAPASEPSAVAETSPRASDPAMPGLDLMSSFARMESVPYLPAEVGTAVIFPPKAPGAEQRSSAASNAAPRDPRPATAEVVPNDAVIEAMEEIAFEPPEVAALRPPEAVAPEPFGTPTPIRVATSTVSAVVVKEPPPPPPKPAEPPQDADAMLFESEADPAAFLLGPAPVPVSPRTFAPELTLPGARVAVTAAPPVPKTAPPPPRPKPVPPPVAAPSDPLAPLKIMREEEKIALFS